MKSPSQANKVCEVAIADLWRRLLLRTISTVFGIGEEDSFCAQDPARVQGYSMSQICRSGLTFKLHTTHGWLHNKISAYAEHQPQYVDVHLHT